MRRVARGSRKLVRVSGLIARRCSREVVYALRSAPSVLADGLRKLSDNLVTSLSHSLTRMVLTAVVVPVREVTRKMRVPHFKRMALPEQNTIETTSAPDLRASPERWWLLALLFAAMLFSYMHRGAFSVAAPFMATELHLSKASIGIILSS